MMEGAALVDDRSGVTFDVELRIPWDAPEAVVDINSAEVVTLGSLPDKGCSAGERMQPSVRFYRGETVVASGFWSQMHAVWTRISTTSR